MGRLWCRFVPARTHRWGHLVQYLAASFLLSVCLPYPMLQAEVSAETRSYLARGPKNIHELWKKAQVAYERSAFDDAASLGEAIFKQGKEPTRVLCLVARCRARSGALDAARSLVNHALELKPHDPEARALCLELEARETSREDGPLPARNASKKPTTLAERLFGEMSTGAREAFDAYYQDRLTESLERANSALVVNPTDPAALLAQALVHRDMGHVDLAAQGVSFLKGRHPKAEVLELLLAFRPNPKREKMLYVQAEKDPRPDPLLLARIAQHKRILLQCRSARESLQRARASIDRPDRETLLAVAAAALDLEDLVTAKELLAEYRALFHEDAWWMVYQAQLRLSQGEMEEAARTGVAAYKKEPRRILVLVHVASLLINAEKEDVLIDLLSLAHETMPSMKGLEADLCLTMERLKRKVRLNNITDGIFHVSVLQDLPSETVTTVLSNFKEAHRRIGALFGHFPQCVKLVIFDGIVGMPGVLAYFNPLDDTIYVGALPFLESSSNEERLAKMVSEHEYTHYVHSELQRRKGLIIRCHRQVKWLAEGLAEWASNGLKWRLEKEPLLLRSEFVGGTMPLYDLEGPELTSNLRGQVKGWYLQGNFMVRDLIERGSDRSRQLDRLVDLSIDLARGEDLAEALKTRFGMTIEQFEKGYSKGIREAMARAAQ